MENPAAEPGTTGSTIGSWFWVQSSTNDVCSAARLVEVLGADVGQNGSLDPQATCVVEFLHGGCTEVPYSQIRGAVDISVLQGAEDLLALSELTEASILHSLRSRYLRSEIYTAIGAPILISINPYEPLPNLFSPEAMAACRESAREEYEMQNLCLDKSSQKPDGAGRDCRPHIFTTAQRAHSRMFREGKSQSIIISGESGSGKTEGAKLILRYLADIGARTGEKSEGDVGTARGGIEELVLRTNPVLEAFGNAQTCRNDNSSRFGKFILVYFNGRTRRISAALQKTYLLEQCRVVGHSRGERSFHVFYQLVHGAREHLPRATVEFLGLETSHASSFTYLKPTIPQLRKDWSRPIRECTAQPTYEADEVDEIAATSNAKAFAELLACFRDLGLSQQEIQGILRVLSAVLHLGNLRFCDSAGGLGAVLGTRKEAEAGEESEDDEVNATAELQAAEIVSRVLGIDLQVLLDLFRGQKFVEPVTQQELWLPRTAKKAAELRDTLAKYLYSQLFRWLVARLNSALDGAAKWPTLSSFGDAAASGRQRTSPGRGGQVLFIGLLDIYGFEVFEENSFEQLCINYANEKLQQHFNHHIFALEQAAYTDEGISWEQIIFTDNEAVISALEQRFTGVFSLLDSENLMPEATDRSFLRKILGKTSSPAVRESDSNLRKATHFVIDHYAGTVEYHSEGFLVKNLGSWSREVVEFVSKSGISCIEDAPALLTSDDARLSSSLSMNQDAGSSVLGDRVKPGRRTSQSVCSNFRKQVKELIETIQATDPFYVRCIKPCAEKKRRNFDATDVLRQLRCAGVLETVRIRRHGYPIRMPFAGFLGQFLCLSPSIGQRMPAGGASSPHLRGQSAASAALSGDALTAFYERSKARETCKCLLTEVEARFANQGILTERGLWQVGKTKVFLKKNLLDLMERATMDHRFSAATCISRHFRGYVERCRYRQTLQTIYRLQARVRGVLRFRSVIREMRAARAGRNRAAYVDGLQGVAHSTTEDEYRSPEKLQVDEAAGSSTDPSTPESRPELPAPGEPHGSARQERIPDRQQDEMKNPQGLTSVDQSECTASPEGVACLFTSVPRESPCLQLPAGVAPSPQEMCAAEHCLGDTKEKSTPTPSERVLKPGRAVPWTFGEDYRHSPRYSELHAQSAGQRGERDRLLEQTLENNFLQTQLEQQRRLLEQQQQLIRQQQELIQERSKERSDIPRELSETEGATAEDVRSWYTAGGTTGVRRQAADSTACTGSAGCLRVAPTSSRSSSGVILPSKCHCCQRSERADAFQSPQVSEALNELADRVAFMEQCIRSSFNNALGSVDKLRRQGWPEKEQDSTASCSLRSSLCSEEGTPEKLREQLLAVDPVAEILTDGGDGRSARKCRSRSRGSVESSVAALCLRVDSLEKKQRDLQDLTMMLGGCVSRNTEALRDLKQSVARIDKHLCSSKRGFRQDPTCGASWMVEGKDDVMSTDWEQQDEHKQQSAVRLCSAIALPSPSEAWPSTPSQNVFPSDDCTHPSPFSDNPHETEVPHQLPILASDNLATVSFALAQVRPVTDPSSADESPRDASENSGSLFSPPPALEDRHQPTTQEIVPVSSAVQPGISTGAHAESDPSLFHGESEPDSTGAPGDEPVQAAGGRELVDEETCESVQSSSAGVQDGSLRDISYESIREDDTTTDAEPVTVRSSNPSGSLWGRFMRRIRGSLTSGSESQDDESDYDATRKAEDWEAVGDDEEL
ncbi:myosin i [Cystoisospora suis]|uniref:Myosin i n=1 Tax=Cystoisospora suis TaxID=483139 RepID=A0A2C6L5R1_9APIC|nr:myosin i [Cystoisospora suis]